VNTHLVACHFDFEVPQLAFTELFTFASYLNVYIVLSSLLSVFLTECRLSNLILRTNFAQQFPREDPEPRALALNIFL